MLFHGGQEPLLRSTTHWRLRLTCCRHSLHAIAAQLSPAPGCTGIELLQADTFDLHCFQTLTGTKMLMVVEPNTPDVDILLRDTCDTPSGIMRQ